MAKERWRHDHAGVVAALVDFQVSAAGQRHLHFDQNFALAHARDGHFFNLQVFFAVQDGSGHFPIHFWFPSPLVLVQVMPG